MFDIRLLSTRSRIAFAGLFASTMAATVATITLMALGLSPASAAIACGAGLIAGAASNRAVERWKMAPLTNRIWARRRSMTAPGETGRLMRVAEGEAVDRHLDALLMDIDGMARELTRLAARCVELEGLAAETRTELTSERARSEAALEAFRGERFIALASQRLVVRASQNDLNALEQLFRRFVNRPVGVPSPGQSHADAFPDLMGVAADMLERLRCAHGVAAYMAQRETPDVISPPGNQTRLGVLLPRIARSAALRLERDIMTRCDDAATVSAVGQDWLLSAPLNVLIDTLGQHTPPRAPFVIETTRAGTSPDDRVELRLGWFQLNGTPGPFDPAVHQTTTADVAAHLQFWSPGATVSADADGWLVSLPVETLRSDSDSGVRAMAAFDGRSILVIDPYAPRRAILCEQLSARRLLPTAASTVDEAILRIRDAERAKRGFDYICIIPDASPESPAGDIWSTKFLDAFLARQDVGTSAKLISLPHICASFDDLSGGHVVSVTRPASTVQLLAALSAPAPTAVAATTTQRNRRKTHVLIGEDNTVTQLHLEKLLQLRGITAVIAHNGAEVVDRFLSDGPGTYDAVLLDIQMPVMDGYETAQILRAREARDGLVRVPIIAVTAHAMTNERNRCLQSGMDEHITKPIDQEALFSTLGRLTGRRFEAPPRMAAPPPTPLKATPAAPPQPKPPAPPTPEPAARRFNREHLMEFAGGDPGFLRKLADIFGRTAPRQVGELAAAHTEGDQEKVRQLAHQLKGAVGNFGAESAQALAARIEKGAREGALDGLDSDIEALRLDVDWIRDTLVAIADEHA